MRRRTVGRVCAGLVAAVVLLQAVPAAVYVLQSDEPTLQAGATWARDHGYGGLVDRLEAWRYTDPPSTAQASDLGVSDEVLSITTSTTPQGTVPLTVIPATTIPATTIPAVSTPGSTTRFAPAALAPVLDKPLPGEGVWHPISELGGQDTVWVTSLRPSRTYGSVLATYVRFDPSLMRGVLYSGSSIPGGQSWTNYKRVQGEARRSLVLTFNGGFRFEHIAGGYKAEGKVARELVKGQASIAIDASGRIAMGVYGRDIMDGPEWVSIRQNLTPLVDGSKSMVTRQNRNRWGSDYGGVLFVPRSALCDMGDGTLMWAIVGDADPDGLADALVLAGCKFGVQLDINGTWPHFAVYRGLGTLQRTPVLVDRRMENAGRFLNGSEKDFFAFFALPTP